jgi:hypothetical protein
MADGRPSFVAFSGMCMALMATFCDGSLQAPKITRRRPNQEDSAGEMSIDRHAMARRQAVERKVTTAKI